MTKNMLCKSAKVFGLCNCLLSRVASIGMNIGFVVNVLMPGAAVGGSIASFSANANDATRGAEVTVNFSGIVSSSSGKNAHQFHDGEHVTGFYT
ncbi:MAG TPA: hypothetical protein VIE65_09490, partial [Methylobacter sp.]